jgi:hypothetical protein
MPAPAFDDEDEKPLDPAVENVRRKLLRFVVINLAILFTAVIVVIGAVVYRGWSERPAAPVVQGGDLPMPPGVLPASGRIALPAGARVVSQSISGHRLSLLADLAEGGRAVFIYDLATSQVIARHDIVAQ